MGAAIIFHKVVQERLDRLTRFIKTMSEVAYTSKNVDGVLAIIFVLHELYISVIQTNYCFRSSAGKKLGF